MKWDYFSKERTSQASSKNTFDFQILKSFTMDLIPFCVRKINYTQPKQTNEISIYF